MDRDQPGAAASQEAVGESGSGGGGGSGGGVGIGVPELVITQAEEPPAAQRPADLQIPVIPVIPVIPLVPRDPILSSSSDGGDVSCCDLLSLRSDSLSLASESEPTISRMSEDDDSRSVTASSVMSLFHRLQLDPLEKDWMRSSAVGNMAAQRRLLAHDSSLVLKKTALHWAAKQGRQDAVDLMLRFGADVNARSGYTPLHLASIHGHQHVVFALIHTHNAKTSIRDYHGKMAVHYWSGCRDVFNQPDSQSGARFCRGRRTQRFVLPSLLLSRSRSQGQLSLEFGPLLPPPSATQDALDLQV